MVRKRARLTDENDPLTSTDEVLAGFERVSQSNSQQDENIVRQKVENTAPRQLVTPESQQAENTTSERDVTSASQQVNNIESQQSEKSKLRKSTFQLNSAILELLDIFHLQLQLELGKANAPYKEVIVEEAIAQLLDRASSNRAELVTVLHVRQAGRS